jgi:hypothetical protein
VYTFSLPHGEKLVWRIFFLSLYFPHFLKYVMSVNFCDFLTPTDAVTENPQKYLAAEKYY